MRPTLGERNDVVDGRCERVWHYGVALQVMAADPAGPSVTPEDGLAVDRGDEGCTLAGTAAVLLVRPSTTLRADVVPCLAGGERGGHRVLGAAPTARARRQDGATAMRALGRLGQLAFSLTPSCGPDTSTHALAVEDGGVVGPLPSGSACVGAPDLGVALPGVGRDRRRASGAGTLGHVGTSWGVGQSPGRSSGAGLIKFRGSGWLGPRRHVAGR